jgi:hypothetical protein
MGLCLYFNPSFDRHFASGLRLLSLEIAAGPQLPGSNLSDKLRTQRGWNNRAPLLNRWRSIGQLLCKSLKFEAK